MKILDSIYSTIYKNISDGDNLKANLNKFVLSVANLLGLVTLFILFLYVLFQPFNTGQIVVISSFFIFYAILYFFQNKIGYDLTLILSYIITSTGIICITSAVNIHPDIIILYPIVLPSIFYLVLIRKTSKIVNILKILFLVATIIIFSLITDTLVVLLLTPPAISTFAIIHLIYHCAKKFATEKKKTKDANVEKATMDNSMIEKLVTRISTPLTNIGNIANTLSEKNFDTNTKTLVDSLIASVETVTDIVDIIDGETHNEELNNKRTTSQRIDLRQIIIQTAEFTPNLEVKLEVNGELPILKGDSLKVRKILLNIFEFFLQNTPKENLPANVTVILNRVRIPIKPVKYRFDVKSDILVPELAEATIPELQIATKLIEELNGNIKRRFEEDMTSIYFNICFDGEEEIASTNTTVNKPIEVSVTETTGFIELPKIKELADADVIICDDNVINQKVMSLSLEKHVHSITTASNGQECVDLLEKTNYDLVLMDIQMPILDGYSATKEIRKREQENSKRHIPIIAVTANTLSGDRHHCLSIGMDDYVSKPYQLEDVISKMKFLISKYPMG